MDFSSLMNMFGGGGGANIPAYFKNAFPATALNNQNLPGLGYGATPGSPMGSPPPSGIPNYFQQANPAQSLSNSMMPGQGFGSAPPTAPGAAPGVGTDNLRQQMLMKALMEQQQNKPGQMQPSGMPGMAPSMAQVPSMQNRFAQQPGQPGMGMPAMNGGMNGGMMQRRFLGQG